MNEQAGLAILFINRVFLMLHFENFEGIDIQMLPSKEPYFLCLNQNL